MHVDMGWGGCGWISFDAFVWVDTGLPLSGPGCLGVSHHSTAERQSPTCPLRVLSYQSKVLLRYETSMLILNLD